MDRIQLHNDYIQKIMETHKNDSEQEKWHTRRSCGLGGSDIGTVMGVNPYKTAFELWQEKTGKKDRFKGNNATEWGHRLEDLVAKKFGELTGWQVKRVNNQFKLKSEPWLLGNIDRMIFKDGHKFAILECKTANAYSDWGDDCWFDNNKENAAYKDSFVGADSIPKSYYLQCQHYMLVTGVHMCYLAVLIGGQNFKIFSVPYNQTIADLIRQIGAAFWFDNVIADREPERVYKDYFDPTEKRLTAKCVSNEYDVFYAISKIKQIKRIKERLDSKKEQYELVLLKNLGADGNILLSADGSRQLATFKSTVKNGFDTDKFKTENPKLYNKYKKQTVCKPSLKIKE